MNYEQIIQSRANYADDAAFLAWANTPTIQRVAVVPLWKIKLRLVELGLWSAFQDPANPVAVAFMDVYRDPRFDNLDMSLPTVQMLLGGAVQIGLLTQEQADDLRNIDAVSTLPMGETVTQADLDTARLEQSREALRIKLQTAFNERINEIDAMTGNVPTTVTITLS